MANLTAQAGMENVSKASVYRAKDKVTGDDDINYAVCVYTVQERPINSNPSSKNNEVIGVFLTV